MSRWPVVSVVVIFRDVERFLDEAIASVWVQTYSDWELLLVDDGSTDGSTMRARRWAARYPERVQYLTHPERANRGMSASRNLGIRHARGQYLAFLDADDVWLPTALIQQVALLESWPEAAMVYGPIEWWYSWTGLQKDQARDYVESLGVPANSLVQPPALLPLFLRNRAAVPSGFLARREAVAQVGGFEDTFRAEYEDQAFCAKMCLQFAVFASSESWYRYRQHSDSCVSVSIRTGRARSARVRFLRWLAGYLYQRGFHGCYVWWAVGYELWRWSHPVQYWLWTRARNAVRRFWCHIGGYSGRLADTLR